jgi:ribosomal protein S12
MALYVWESSPLPIETPRKKKIIGVTPVTKNNTTMKNELEDAIVTNTRGLVFTTYVPKEGANLDDFGTVLSQIPGGSLKFCPGSITRYKAGVIKSVSILLEDRAGDSCTLPMSKTLTAQVIKAMEKGMKKKDALGIIAKLTIWNDGDVFIIGRPGNTDWEEEISLTEKQATKVTLTYDELIGF